MDLRATEVTRWIDAGLSGLAFGNEHHCFVVQRSVEPEQAPVQGYYLSTEESVLTAGGIISLSVYQQVLRLQLSTQAADHLGLPETLFIDISQADEAEGAVSELAQMVGIGEGYDHTFQTVEQDAGQLALFA